MNKSDLDPAMVYRFIFKLKDAHVFWKAPGRINYCRQTCFRDDWEMAGRCIDDPKRIKKWFNKNKRFWNKEMVAMICKQQEVFNTCMNGRGDETLI